jgi:hypothetical protein
MGSPGRRGEPTLLQSCSGPHRRPRTLWRRLRAWMGSLQQRERCVRATSLCKRQCGAQVEARHWQCGVDSYGMRCGENQGQAGPARPRPSGGRPVAHTPAATSSVAATHAQFAVAVNSASIGCAPEQTQPRPWLRLSLIAVGKCQRRLPLLPQLSVGTAGGRLSTLWRSTSARGVLAGSHAPQGRVTRPSRQSDIGASCRRARRCQYRRCGMPDARACACERIAHRRRGSPQRVNRRHNA